MRVCIISPRAYTLFNSAIVADFGGAEVQLSLICKQLSLNPNFEVHLLVADYGQPETEVRSGITVWKSYRLDDGLPGQVKAFIQTLVRIRADVYIQRTLTPYSAFIAMLCSMMGVRFIYMVAHDMEIDGTHPLLRTWYGRMAFRILSLHASAMIVQSRFQQTMLRQKGIPSELIRSIHEIRESTAQKDIDALWVGRCEPWKRPDVFLKVASDLPEFRFVMICPPAVQNNGLFEEIEKQAGEIKNLQFIRLVPFTRIGSYFQRTRLFVNTSTYEGFPNTFLQALSNGVPILSLFVDPDGLLEEFQCGQVSNGEVEPLTSEVRRFLHDEKLRSCFGVNGMNYVRLHHNPQTNMKPLTKILESVKP